MALHPDFKDLLGAFADDEDLIAIKLASGRPQDELDLVWLEQAATKQKA